MSTNFSKNAINMSEVPATKVDAPTTSKDVKLFQENGEFKVKDFSGKVSPLVPPQQEVKIASVEVNTNEDANSYTLVIPSPNAKLAALEKTLVALVEQTKGDFQLSITEALATIQSWKDSQELANGVMDSSISEIEDKVSEIDKGLAGKTDASDFSNLQADLATIVGNINNTLATKKQLETAIREVKAELHEPAKVVAGTPNVKVETAGQTFTISVDVQEKVTETVIREVAKGGVSKKFVMDYVDAAVENISGGGGTGTVATITSNDGSIIVTPIVDGYDLQVASSGTVLQGRFQLDDVNTTFTIPHSTISSSIEFPVCSLNVATSASDLFIVGIHDRTNTSFKVTISGVADSSTYIIWHIITQSFSGGGGGGASNSIIDLGSRMNTDSIFDCGTRI